MQVTTIFGKEFPTIQDLKDFAALNGISPAGNKTFKATWINAITGHYLTAQSSAIATAVKANPIASTIATKTEEVAVKAITVTVEVLTSEAAVLVYRVILKTIAFALVMCWLLSVASAKWCWRHRSHTAVYHWIKDALSSEATQWAVVYLFLGQWIINEWIDTVRSVVRSTATACRVWADGIVGEVRSSAVRVGRSLNKYSLVLIRSSLYSNQRTT